MEEVEEVVVELLLLRRRRYFGGRERASVIGKRGEWMMLFWLLSPPFYPPAGTLCGTVLPGLELACFRLVPMYCRSLGILST
jgi:hypothetical protein